MRGLGIAVSSKGPEITIVNSEGYSGSLHGLCVFHTERRPTCRLVWRQKLGPLLKGVCTWLFHNKKTIGHNDFKAGWNGTFSLWKTGGVCLFDVKYLYEIMCRTLRIFLYKGHVTFHIKWKVITMSIKCMICMISFKNKWTPYDQISCKFYFDWPSYEKITEVLALRNYM